MDNLIIIQWGLQENRWVWFCNGPKQAEINLDLTWNKNIMNCILWPSLDRHQTRYDVHTKYSQRWLNFRNFLWSSKFFNYANMGVPITGYKLVFAFFLCFFYLGFFIHLFSYIKAVICAPKAIGVWPYR